MNFEIHQSFCKKVSFYEAYNNFSLSTYALSSVKVQLYMVIIMNFEFSGTLHTGMT